MTQWFPGAAGVMGAVVVIAIGTAMGYPDWLLLPASIVGLLGATALWMASPLPNSNMGGLS